MPLSSMPSSFSRGLPTTWMSSNVVLASKVYSAIAFREKVDASVPSFRSLAILVTSVDPSAFKTETLKLVSAPAESLLPYLSRRWMMSDV